MSGDVQPRKRKDKKRKREDDESSHGVHITKMGTEDVHLHVHHEHETGGHWCAKILFFALLAILLGLVSLIILENRGLADLDTPLSESRFSNYFDGWVDEKRESHDDHDIQASIEDHEEHDEVFEEEEPLSEVDDEDLTAENDDEEAEDEEDDHNDEDEEDDEENDEEPINAATEDDEENDEEDEEDNATQEIDITLDDNDDDDDEEEADDTNTLGEEDENDDDTNTAEREDENDDDTNTAEQEDENDEDINNDDDDGDDDDNNENDDEDNDGDNIQSAQNTKEKSRNSDDPFDEDEDDDDTIEIFDKVVDNDAEEILLLQQKAAQLAAKNQLSAETPEENEAVEEESSWVNRIAVKLVVGVAMVVVARILYHRKKHDSNDIPTEGMMKRRLTIAGPEDIFPEDMDAPMLPKDEIEEEIDEAIIEFIEEDYEEEIEEEEEEIEVDEDGIEIERSGKYMPESFEELNAMYRAHPKTQYTPAPKVELNIHKTTPPRDFSLKISETKAVSPQQQKPPPVFVAPPPPQQRSINVVANMEFIRRAPITTTNTATRSNNANTLYTTEPTTSGNNFRNDRFNPRERTLLTTPTTATRSNNTMALNATAPTTSTTRFRRDGAYAPERQALTMATIASRSNNATMSHASAPKTPFQTDRAYAPDQIIATIATRSNNAAKSYSIAPTTSATNFRNDRYFPPEKSPLTTATIAARSSPTTTSYPIEPTSASNFRNERFLPPERLPSTVAATATTLSPPTTSNVTTPTTSAATFRSDKVYALEGPTPQRSEAKDRSIELSSNVATTITTSASALASPYVNIQNRNLTNDLDFEREPNYNFEPYDGKEYSSDDDYDDDDDLDQDISDLDDISDVDDAELMERLEAKYGKLPISTQPDDFESDEDPDDPTWTQIKQKPTTESGGAQEFGDIDDSFEVQLNRAKSELERENFAAAYVAYSKLSQEHADQPEGFFGKCKSLYELNKRDDSKIHANSVLYSCKRYLAFNELIKNDTVYRTIAEITLDVIEELGVLIQARDIYKSLLERFPKDTNLLKRFALNEIKLQAYTPAERLLEEVLISSPGDGFALAHYGLIFKLRDRDYRKAIILLQKGIASKAKGTQNAFLYLQLGEAYQRLNMNEEAQKVFTEAARLKFINSAMQRSIHYVPNLRNKPFWNLEETEYKLHLQRIQENWKIIRQEGMKALTMQRLYQNEAENLRDYGTWKMFQLFSRGSRHSQHCKQTPKTCALIEAFPAARHCRQGQVKFSILEPKTHIWPHCGPTNARLRAHLGLIIPDGAEIRVADIKRSWTEGEFLIFDDSFEHEVWHEGKHNRLVLIVDFWHPDLDEEQKHNLPSI